MAKSGTQTPRPRRFPGPDAIGALLQAGRGRLPPLAGRTRTVAATDTAETLLGRRVEPLVAAHPGRSGVVALADGRDAFAARALLAAAAECTLDVQYYIWQRDRSGMLLLDALRDAADRGVRVRLLLDDNNTAGLDRLLAALAAHPRVEVRLFNPFLHRRWRLLGYLTDFHRLNRRMHNKSFTVDNQVTIIGGRNIGDEYFDAGEGLLFADLDVMAIGPVVREVSADFDRYWACGSAYPAERILPPPAADGLRRLADAARRVARDPAAAAYVRSLEASPFVQDLLGGRLEFEWAPTHMVSDDPAKGLGRAEDSALLPRRLAEVVGEPARELLLVSAYFVPTAEGVELLGGLARAGVRVAVLTNSLEATDVAVVHAGYQKRRKALLAAGVELYEMKRGIAGPEPHGRWLAGSSASSLHAKTFGVDRARIFIGSFNFDPRSARLNTEMGVVIASPALAATLAEIFAQDIPARAYRLRLAGGRVEWLEQRADGTRVHTIEPNAGFLRRAAVRLLSWLPIEWLL